MFSWSANWVVHIKLMQIYFGRTKFKMAAISDCIYCITSLLALSTGLRRNLLLVANNVFMVRYTRIGWLVDLGFKVTF